MTIRVQLRQGPKQAITTTFIAEAPGWPDALTALLAAVPTMPGWRLSNLKPTYALWIGPDDTPFFCQAIIATPPPVYEPAPAD